MWFNKKKNILITGAKGQLGSYLVRELTKMSFKQMSKIGQVFGIDISDLDLTDSFAVADFFNYHVADPSVKIHYVVHCAAATDTVAIERDPLKFYAANVIGTKNVAESCAYNGIKMIHISTDYVMSELSPDKYGNQKIEFPVNQYGMQKLLAEKEAQIAYMKSGHPERLTIGRLSWLFGNSQNSFVEKFLRNAFKNYVEAKNSGVDCSVCQRVVDDAYGKPTPVDLVLSCIVYTIYDNACGIHDFQFKQFNPISRFEWAQMILSSFYSMLDKYKSLDSKFVELASDMKIRLKLTAVKSSELNVGMRHPGLVGKIDMSLKTNGSSAYVECTDKYVNGNSRRLIDMMIDEFSKVK